MNVCRRDTEKNKNIYFKLHNAQDGRFAPPLLTRISTCAPKCHEKRVWSPAKGRNRVNAYGIVSQLGL